MLRVTPAIDRARPDEADAVERLLAENHLPLEGLRDHLTTAVVARQGGRVVGSAALEVYRDGALLRSVAVTPGLQGTGLGRQLTNAAIQLARELRAPAVYLLTTTAERYFPKFGFERIERSDVPLTVQSSIEFRSACPSTAIVMRKRLTPQRVVFACIHNAGRSQMAAAFFHAMADPRLAEAVSAGTDPGTRVHPEVVRAMQEVGIDVGANVPRRLTDDLARDASLLITMGCGDECPYVPGLARDDWPLQDPKGRPAEEVRAIRDEIRGRVKSLIDSRSWGP